MKHATHYIDHASFTVKSTIYLHFSVSLIYFHDYIINKLIRISVRQRGIFPDTLYTIEQCYIDDIQLCLCLYRLTWN